MGLSTIYRMVHVCLRLSYAHSCRLFSSLHSYNENHSCEFGISICILFECSLVAYRCYFNEI